MKLTQSLDCDRFFPHDPAGYARLRVALSASDSLCYFLQVDQPAEIRGSDPDPDTLQTQLFIHWERRSL